MDNERIGNAFDEVADLLEFTGSNPFRVRAYRNASRTIRGLSQSLRDAVDRGDDLTQMEGIGDDLAGKIIALARTGKLEMLEELRSKVPDGVMALLRIPGVGPKKAALLFKELGIKSLDELRTACEQGRVRELKGFGAKTEEGILKGIDVAAQANQRMFWSEADEIAQSLRRHMRGCPRIEQLEFAGSYRRGQETVGDLDMLVVSSEIATVMNQFACYPGIAAVIGRGDTKMSVRLDSGLQIDLRVVPRESYGAALQYFTGSKEHNVVVRGMAKQAGMKINEYGVFRVDGEQETYVAGASEAEVYATLGLPLFPPEMREARQEFEWARQGELPRLIELSDLRGDLHMHTTATDGAASIEQMIAAARKRGLEYIAITDHSQRVSMARGLDAQRVLAQWAEIDRIRRELDDDFVLLKGIECDILEKGGMDLPDEVLAQADWVLASVHYGQRQSRAEITERILGALDNPYVTAIAHPTGRLLNQREPYEVDLEAVFRRAKERGKILELNANPHRLDLNDLHCAAARKLGIPIVISTDAHSVNGLDVMRYGILQARRAGLTRDDVINTRPWPQLRKMLRNA
ncbi:MAG: DNA polymerase/3'-5' exonuclease PolX [Planctomycetes bacterium]|nr:DNA polymerase/3'-5' exonuclease PolX [Planctomycetota bacterium]